MQVTVEAPNKLERRLTIVVPVETMDAAYDKRIANLSKTAKVKGFRPGKVPLTYVKQYYGDVARQEALSEVIQSSLYSAMQQEKLHPVGVPTVEPKTVIAGQPLEFIAVFEVFPEVGNVSFAMNAIEKHVAKITEADITQVVERLRSQHITWRKVDRIAKEKDQVVIDFRGTIDGRVFTGGEAHDYPIVLGSKTMLPGFEEGLIGTKAGEEKIISVAFPENYFAKEVAGKSAEFTTQVRQVSEPDMPELNSDLIKKLGIENGKLEDLHTEIKNNLEREKNRMVQAKLKAQVFDKLLEQNPLDVPNALIKQEAKRIHDQVHSHHGEHKHTAAEMAVFETAAKRNVILGLLVGEYAKQQKLAVDKTRVKAHLENVASAYENPNEIIQWYSSDKRRFAEIEMFVLEEQIMEKLLEGVSITEKPISYNELIAQYR